MALQQDVVAIRDHVFHGQTYDRSMHSVNILLTVFGESLLPKSSNTLCRELRALREDSLVHCLKLDLIPDPEKSSRHYDWHSHKNRHQRQFPPKHKSDNDATREAKKGNDDHGHVDAEHLLELGRIVGYTCRECARGIFFLVEEGDGFVKDGFEVLLTVCASDVLLRC